jgi:DNA modification methylase
MELKKKERSATPYSNGPELVWSGKYDTHGRRRCISEQTVQIRPLEVFSSSLLLSPTLDGQTEISSESGNRLIWGDNLLVMNSLKESLARSIDLIYFDPPFDTGANFEYKGEVGERKHSSQPPRIVRSCAYRDCWNRASGEWFSMIFDRLERARELLSERGTLYLHLDWNAGHHIRPLLDEIFGHENSLGEIIWAYGSPSGGRTAGKKLIKAHDIIFVFAKKYGKHRFRTVYLPYSEHYVKGWFKYCDEDGRLYRKRWRRDANGVSYVEKQYLDQSKGMPASTVWKDIQQIYADPRAYKQGVSASEITGYPTQKPLRLMERMLEISTEPGDLVADVFCGSGTTLLAAEKLKRRWIGCDCGMQAIHTTTQRLLHFPLISSFQVQICDDRKRPPLALVPKVSIRRSNSEVKVVLDAPRNHAGTKWVEPIDRWAVDWNYNGVFVPKWIGFRTRECRSLPLESGPMPKGGDMSSVVIQVVDIQGAASFIFVQKGV